MSEHFEILCPECQSVVPADASGCPKCKAGSFERAMPPAPPEIGSMRLKEYHRLVRTNYWAVEGAHVMSRPPGSLRFRTYLPFVLLVLGLVIGTVVALGRF